MCKHTSPLCHVEVVGAQTQYTLEARLFTPVLARAPSALHMSLTAKRPKCLLLQEHSANAGMLARGL